jgi:hypothetical protein
LELIPKSITLQRSLLALSHTFCSQLSLYILGNEKSWWKNFHFVHIFLWREEKGHLWNEVVLLQWRAISCSFSNSGETRLKQSLEGENVSIWWSISTNPFLGFVKMTSL